MEDALPIDEAETAADEPVGGNVVPEVFESATDETTGFGDAAAVSAGELAGRVHQAGRDAAIGQLASDWASADRQAAEHRRRAIEARLRSLDGVEGANVRRWRAFLQAQLDRTSA